MAFGINGPFPDKWGISTNYARDHKGVNQSKADVPVGQPVESETKPTELGDKLLTQGFYSDLGLNIHTKPFDSTGAMQEDLVGMEDLASNINAEDLKNIEEMADMAGISPEYTLVEAYAMKIEQNPNAQKYKQHAEHLFRNFDIYEIMNRS